MNVSQPIHVYLNIRLETKCVLAISFSNSNFSELLFRFKAYGEGENVESCVAYQLDDLQVLSSAQLTVTLC